MPNNFILPADTINNIAGTSIQNIKKQTRAIIEAEICLIVKQMTMLKRKNNPHLRKALYEGRSLLPICTLLCLSRLSYNQSSKKLPAFLSHIPVPLIQLSP